jgi:hypothetical protein
MRDEDRTRAYELLEALDAQITLPEPDWNAVRDAAAELRGLAEGAPDAADAG